ncbi:hypothetical protein HYV73_04075 [Candidatus Uhrbacteria bacterium]|nr:hypothetical protein [Candidatus Uhrbacteria bacterium]
MMNLSEWRAPPVACEAMAGKKATPLRSFVLCLLLAASCLLPAFPASAATFPHCTPFDTSATLCSEAKCGAIMCGITTACADKGNCQLPDIMQLVVNVGNMLIGLVAAVALLAFTWGGFQIIFGGARPEMYANGKKTIKIATFGLILTLSAGVLVQALNSALRTKGEITGSAACDALTTTSQFWACVDTTGTNTLTTTQLGTCKTNLCPGSPTEIRCCCIAGECTP